MATAASELRLRLARRAARAWAAHEDVAAVLVAGSAARGEADRWSDVELGVFWRRPPSDEERTALVAAAGGDLVRVEPFDEAERVWVDDWRLGRRAGAERSGLSIDGVHMTVEDAERQLDDVVVRHDPDPVKQLLLAALHDGEALHGEALLAGWRERATYPDGLARAVVARHGQIDHAWRFAMFAERGNALQRADSLARLHARVLHALHAVNRVHWRGAKFPASTYARLRLAPAGLADRIEGAYALPDPTALVEPLVEETYDLVERHVPGVDVERLRRIFRSRRPLWDAEEPELAERP